MEVKFVGLKLIDSNWDPVCKTIVERYGNDILISKASVEFKGHLYEIEPHVTVYYNDKCTEGPNVMYFRLTVGRADLYDKLFENKSIEVPILKLKLFDNLEFKVLVIDLSAVESTLKDIIYPYNEYLSKLYGVNQDYPEYHPHITITYLNKDFDESNLKLIEQYLNDNLDHQFQITDIMLGGTEDGKYNSLKLPII